ncbi:MAG: alpha/beta hydrolase [Candidatus Heimdallarchaeota archaeon]|nr:alpha/beta hydrolase [Candidatus Heimdallarchaeota archaeon]
MKYTDDFFTGGENHQIYYQSWIPDKPKAIVQIIHGGVEHVGRYKHLVDYLVTKNFAVYGNDHRGHGKSEGRRNHSKSLEDMVDDCNKLTQIIQKENKDIPIFIVGHSMGSLLAQRFAIKHQKEMKGLILSGTGTQVPPLPTFLNIFARIIVKVLPTFKGPAGIIPEELSSDPESVEDYVTDPLINYKQATVRYGLNLIDHYKDVKEKISTIKIPILIQKGELDTMIINLDELTEDLKNTDLTVIIYKNGKHEMYTEIKEKREEAFADLVKWLNAYL